MKVFNCTVGVILTSWRKVPEKNIKTDEKVASMAVGLRKKFACRRYQGF